MSASSCPLETSSIKRRMNKLDEYHSLVGAYRRGMYTRGEVVSASLGLLFECDDRLAFWQALSVEHRDEMRKVLVEFDPAAEPFALRPADPAEQWRQLSDLKRWLAAQ